MGSGILETRAPPPQPNQSLLSVPRQSHRHSISGPRLSITTRPTPAVPPTMDQRYYTRPSSPGGRRIANAGRASASQLGGYDHYYGAQRPAREYVDPRASGERIVPNTSHYVSHTPSSSSNTGSTLTSRSSAGYDAYSGRPRRSTLEGGETRRPVSLNLSSRHRPAAVIHTQNDRPSSPLARHYDDRGRDYDYPPPPKREHKKVYSVDDGQSRLIEEKDIKPRRERRPSVERTANRHSAQIGGSRQQYYPNASIVAPRDTEDYYSYTDPAKMYSETEPSWRPRRNSVERSSRPSSMIIEPAAPAMKPVREYGPPVSTRGFDKINGSSGLGRSGSLRDRDSHHRTSSRDRATERARDIEHTSVYRDNIPEPYILPQDAPPRSHSALPAAPRTHQVRDDRDRYRDTVYDEPASERHHRRRSTYEDPDVTTRGFGIRSGSIDKYPQDHNIDRQATYPPQPPVAEPLSIPDPRNYQPADLIPPPIPPPSARDGRDVRRDDRDRAPEMDRESHRDRDYRDKPRDHKDRDRERDRDRDRERDRPRDRDYDRYYDRDDKSRRDRDRDDREKDSRGNLLPAAAVAGTAAAAAAGYGLHKKEKEREDRRDDRRYEDERSAPRPSQSAPTRDFPQPPPPVDNHTIPPMVAGRAPPIPPPERSHTDDRRPPPSSEIGHPDERRGQPQPLDRGLQDERRAPLPSDRSAPEDRRGPQSERGPEERKVQLPPPPPQDEYRKAPDDRSRAPNLERPRPQQQSSDSMDTISRERHYVDRDADRDAARQEPKKAETIDPDEDYRRRVQAAQADLQRGGVRQPPPPSDRDSSGSDRERRRRDRGYGTEHDRHDVERAPAVPTPIPGPPGAYPADDVTRDFHERDVPSRAPPRSDRPGDRSSGVFDRQLVQDPEEYDEPERDRRVNIVAPPKESPPPVKGILRRPTEKFPEDPNPIREGVAPLKDAKVGKDIPPNARWTKIDRRLVNPEALKEAKERFEERLDCVIVLRVLSKDDIQKLADRTREIREVREEGGDRGKYKSPLNSDTSLGLSDLDSIAWKSGEARDDFLVEYNTKLNEYSGPSAKDLAAKIAKEHAANSVKGLKLLTQGKAPSDYTASEVSTLASQAPASTRKTRSSSDLKKSTSLGRSHPDVRLETSTSGAGKLRDLKQALNPFSKKDRRTSITDSTINDVDIGNATVHRFDAPVDPSRLDREQRDVRDTEVMQLGRDVGRTKERSKEKLPDFAPNFDPERPSSSHRHRDRDFDASHDRDKSRDRKRDSYTERDRDRDRERDRDHRRPKERSSRDSYTVQDPPDSPSSRHHGSKRGGDTSFSSLATNVLTSLLTQGGKDEDRFNERDRDSDREDKRRERKHRRSRRRHDEYDNETDDTEDYGTDRSEDRRDKERPSF